MVIYYIIVASNVNNNSKRSNRNDENNNINKHGNNVSKIGNSGQMIMGGTNIAQMSYNQHMPMMQPMNPMQQMPNMHPYNYGLNQYNQQQLGQYNMFTPPVMYNPYTMMAQPLNNYTRGFNAPSFHPGMNSNIGNVTQGANYLNKDISQPVKLIGNNISNAGNIAINSTREQAKDNKLLSRREADKAKRSNSIKTIPNDSHNQSNETYNNSKNSYIEGQNSSYLSNGPATNPELFNRRRNQSANRPRSNADGSYRPYTLQEYKEIASTKIVLGKLGPNLGTKEWEEKAEKMKKLQEYSSKVIKQHRDAFSKVKESPADRIERERREKNEQTSSHKAKEYAKLIKPKQRGDYDYSMEETKEITQEPEYKNYINFHNRNTQRIPSAKNTRYDENVHSTEVSRREDNSNELEKLQRQRENYNLRINQIKESLLK